MFLVREATFPKCSLRSSATFADGQMRLRELQYLAGHAQSPFHEKKAPSFADLSAPLASSFKLYWCSCLSQLGLGLLYTQVGAFSQPDWKYVIRLACCATGIVGKAEATRN